MRNLRMQLTFSERGRPRPREVKQYELADEGVRAPFASSSSSSFVLVLDFCSFFEDEDEVMPAANSRIRIFCLSPSVLIYAARLGYHRDMTFPSLAIAKVTYPSHRFYNRRLAGSRH
jgi:Fe-S cluster assembly iron-binding protein IscA